MSRPIRWKYATAGELYVRGSSQPRLRISDVTEEIGEMTILGKGSREPNREDKELRTFGAQFVEVEVDTATGEVQVLRAVTVRRLRPGDKPARRPRPG